MGLQKCEEKTPTTYGQAHLLLSKVTKRGEQAHQGRGNGISCSKRRITGQKPDSDQNDLSSSRTEPKSSLTPQTNVPDGASVIGEFPLGRFNLKYLGTGEGAQAYGYGLYFADDKALAEMYRTKLAGRGRELRFEGKPIEEKIREVKQRKRHRCVVYTRNTRHANGPSAKSRIVAALTGPRNTSHHY